MYTKKASLFLQARGKTSQGEVSAPKEAPSVLTEIVERNVSFHAKHSLPIHNTEPTRVTVYHDVGQVRFGLEDPKEPDDSDDETLPNEDARDYGPGGQTDDGPIFDMDGNINPAEIPDPCFTMKELVQLLQSSSSPQRIISLRCLCRILENTQTCSSEIRARIHQQLLELRVFANAQFLLRANNSTVLGMTLILIKAFFETGTIPLALLHPAAFHFGEPASLTITADIDTGYEDEEECAHGENGEHSHQDATVHDLIHCVDELMKLAVRGKCNEEQTGEILQMVEALSLSSLKIAQRVRDNREFLDHIHRKYLQDVAWPNSQGYTKVHFLACFGIFVQMFVLFETSIPRALAEKVKNSAARWIAMDELPLVQARAFRILELSGFVDATFMFDVLQDYRALIMEMSLLYPQRETSSVAWADKQLRAYAAWRFVGEAVRYGKGLEQTSEITSSLLIISRTILSECVQKTQDKDCLLAVAGCLHFHYSPKAEQRVSDKEHFANSIQERWNNLLGDKTESGVAGDLKTGSFEGSLNGCKDSAIWVFLNTLLSRSIAMAPVKEDICSMICKYLSRSDSQREGKIFGCCGLIDLLATCSIEGLVPIEARDHFKLHLEVISSSPSHYRKMKERSLDQILGESFWKQSMNVDVDENLAMFLQDHRDFIKTKLSDQKHEIPNAAAMKDLILFPSNLEFNERDGMLQGSLRFYLEIYRFIGASSVQAQVKVLEILFDAAVAHEIEEVPESNTLIAAIIETSLLNRASEESLSPLFSKFRQVTAEFVATGRPYLALIVTPLLAKDIPQIFRKTWWDEAVQAALESSEKEKQNLEKELKKTKELIPKTKEKSLQQVLDENSKLKNEVEVLQDQKAQNEALKENMHQLANQFDQQRIQYAKLAKRLEESAPAPEDGTDKKLTDELIESFEKTIKELRDENQKLQLQRKQDPDTKKPTVDSQAKGWWSRTAATTATQKPADAAPQPKPAETSKAEEAKHATEKSSGTEKSSQPAAQATGGWQWWNKGATAGTAQNPTAADQTKSQDAAKKSTTHLAESGKTTSERTSTVQSTQSTVSLKQSGDDASSEIESLKKELKSMEDKYNDIIKRVAARKKDVTDETLLQVLNEITSQTADSTTSPKPDESYTHENKLSELEKKLADQIKIAAEQEVKASENEKKVKEKEATVAELERKVREHEQRALDSERKVAEQEHKTTEHEQKAAELQRALETARSDLLKKNADYDSTTAEKEKLLQELEVLKSSISRKAEELGKIEKNLKDLENENSDLKIKSLSLTSADNSNSSQDQEASIQKFKQELEERVKAEHSKFEGQIEKERVRLKEEFNQAKKSLEDEKHQLDSRYSKEIGQLNEKLKREAEQIDQLRKDVVEKEEASKRERAEMDQQSKSLKVDIEKLKSELIAAEEKAKKDKSADESQLNKEKADFNDKLKAAEERFKKEKIELEEKLKKERNELEEKLKKERAEYEEKQKKERSGNEEKLKKERSDLEEKLKKDKADADDKFAKISKEKVDLEEKFKKEKAEAEEKSVKEKADIEEKHKKEKLKIQQDHDKAKADFEKSKKDLETQKGEQIKKLEKELAAKSEELAKNNQKLKTFETEATALKSDSAKAAASLKEAIGEKERIGKEIEQIKAKEKSLQEEIETLNEKSSNFQSKLDVLTAEHEVLLSAYDRASKGNAEKDDQLKKQRARIEELQHIEQSLKRNIQKLEKERDELVSLGEKKSKELEDSKHVVEGLYEKLAETAAKLDSQTGVEQKLKDELAAAQRNLADTEHQIKIVERKSAQLVKDLQKQLMKERKNKDATDDTRESEFDQSNSRPHSDPRAKARGSILMPDGLGLPGGGDKHKFELITEDLLRMAQENEQLNKRARHAEEEARSLNERVLKMGEELEGKSKVIQQYVLRDHSAQLQPDEKHKPGAFNVSILSNTNAMHKLDPHILSQVNVKMQKLLEELATKVAILEQENKTLKASPTVGYS
ncbi:hypothetical protein HDU97_002554 [Phlyctochytrium planicorne]|nr:hypothetical protein HDU97_002554 [Phlyctochytrium planicorne]